MLLGFSKQTLNTSKVLHGGLFGNSVNVSDYRTDPKFPKYQEHSDQ